MSDKLRIFINTSVLYTLTLAVGLAAAWQHAVHPNTLGAIPAIEFTLQDALIFIGVFTVFTFIMVKFIRVARASLGVFLVLALVAGAQFVASSWVPWPIDLVIALALVLARRLFPIVIVHDISIVVGIAGVSGLLGLSLNPLIVAAILATLSVYDIISVYRTRHMVALAGRMMESGAVFGFLVPARPSVFFMPIREAMDQRAVMMLGSGDIGLPLVLAASSVPTSLPAAGVVAAFSLVGVMVMQWLFSHQENPAPMAALPPIAAAAILGYVFATLIGL